MQYWIGILSGIPVSLEKWQKFPKNRRISLSDVEFRVGLHGDKVGQPRKRKKKNANFYLVPQFSGLHGTRWAKVKKKTKTIDVRWKDDVIMPSRRRCDYRPYCTTRSLFEFHLVFFSFFCNAENTFLGSHYSCPLPPSTQKIFFSQKQFLSPKQGTHFPHYSCPPVPSKKNLSWDTWGLRRV